VSNEEKPKKKESELVAVARALAEAVEHIRPVRATLMYVSELGYDGFVEVRADKLSTELLHQLEVAVKGVNGKPRGGGSPPDKTTPATAGAPYCPVHPDRQMRPSKKHEGYYCTYSWTDPASGQRRYCGREADADGNPIPPREPGE